MRLGRLGVELGAIEDPPELWLLERGDRAADAGARLAGRDEHRVRRLDEGAVDWSAHVVFEPLRALLVAQERAVLAPGD